jgi:hypothetical protein
MRWLARALVAVLVLVAFGGFALFGGLGPVAFLPGGWLWGERREPPADWSYTDEIKEVQLQTHVGLLPWSVTTWVMSSDGELYIGASECERVWTHRVMADPNIRVRIDGAIYELRAREVTDLAVAGRVAKVTMHKYFGIESESANWIEGKNEGCLFRIEPRT